MERGPFDIFRRFQKRRRRLVVRFNDNLASGQTLAECPLAGFDKKVELKKIQVITPAAFTADANNYKTVTIKNKGTAGSGTNVIAAVDFGKTANLVAFDIVDLGTLAYDDVAANGVISITVGETGSGTRPDLTKMEVIIEYFYGDY